MEAVIQKLIEFKKSINLRERYKYSFNLENTIFSDLERNSIKNENGNFEKNVLLKKILERKYKEEVNNNFSAIDTWIINEWGKIKGFKETKRNKEKIKRFRKELDDRTLSRDSFQTISSLSKLSSFMKIEEYFIYDSRVIFVLNWLILTLINKNEFKHSYFPIPKGRNRIISDFDLNTIINLYHIDKYGRGENLYLSYNEAYFTYCDFIKSAFKRVLGETAKPYELEMFLFCIADKKNFEGIKRTLKITLTERL